MGQKAQLPPAPLQANNLVLVVNHISVNFPLTDLFSVFVPFALFALDVVIEYMSAKRFLDERVFLCFNDSFLS